MRRLFRTGSDGQLPGFQSARSWPLRLRMMMRNTTLIVVAGILLSAGIGGVAYYYSTLPTYLRIAVGPPNSEDTRIVQAVAQQLARDRASIRLRPVIKDSRDAGLTIDHGEADLAVVRRDSGMPRDGLAVAILRKNVAILIVPAPPAAKGSGVKAKTTAKTKAKAAKPAKVASIEKIENLVGRRLGVVGRTQSNLDLLKAVLAQYGIAPDKIVVLRPGEEVKPNEPGKVTVVQFETAGIAAAIRDSKVRIDAILTVGPLGSRVTTEAVAAATQGTTPPTFLAIGAAEAIAERNPVYESTEIKAGAFGGAPARPEENLDTIGVNHYILASRKLGEDVVAELTRRLFLIRQRLATDLPATAKIEAPDTDKDAAVQAHPGAAAYIDGDVKTFFDRYNDLLYWGLMVASLLGSGLAGVMSYTKSDDRVRRVKALEHLLEVTKAARGAETLAQVEELQADADALLTTMVDEIGRNKLDESTLMAFSVAFDHARSALSDRRATLLGQPPPRPLSVVA